jgi:predicted DNA-binding WGR domain protein
MTRVYLEKIDPAENMRRFYSIRVIPTLFGEWAVIREWGRIGSPGTVREEWFESEEQATSVAHRVKTSKERRGYCSGEDEALGL